MYVKKANILKWILETIMSMHIGSSPFLKFKKGLINKYRKKYGGGALLDDDECNFFEIWQCLSKYLNQLFVKENLLKYQ